MLLLLFYLLATFNLCLKATKLRLYFLILATAWFSGIAMGYKSVKAIFSIDKTVVDHLLELLKDKEFIISSLPCVVARFSNKILLRFSRLLLFRVDDVYSLDIEQIDKGIVIKLFGEKSTVTLIFRLSGNDKIEYIGEYNGPKQWVVVPCLEDIGRSVIKDVTEEARRRSVERSRTAAGADYSALLAKVSWVSKLLLRSVLIKSEIVAINKGSLISYIEDLASEGVLSKYKTIYVSGTSDIGSFRMLFINGELVGVYSLIRGKEYVGDDKVLNEFEGFTRIRVYGSNVEPSINGG